MKLTAIYAHLDCSDLARSTDWFATLFGRPPDVTPMDGLAEWHHGGTAGLQLYREPSKAGTGTLTLIVDEIRAARERLADLAPGEVEEADYTSIVRMRDPDGNLIVLAQPRGG